MLCCLSECLCIVSACSFYLCFSRALITQVLLTEQCVNINGSLHIDRDSALTCADWPSPVIAQHSLLTLEGVLRAPYFTVVKKSQLVVYDQGTIRPKSTRMLTEACLLLFLALLDVGFFVVAGTMTVEGQ